ncbi:membrane bound O-acyl transferase family-domain-containing protein [Aspergillus avenaceus]|uniref:Membrane bound O-acyl transferase family-domain-containing protein n=1 Tax=Aspergillus avenaceus TaxID=36643 RepID=A0A5N6U2I5_ASPAV|nr:membrane bound O-acyl transferase family-domain-containing protein [Aspergillus avenaceus]
MSIPPRDVAIIVLASYVPAAILGLVGFPRLVEEFYIANGLTLMILSHAIPIFVLAFAAPSSPVRLMVLPFAAIASVMYHKLAPEYFSSRNQAGGMDGPFMLMFLTVVNVFGIQQLYRDDRGVERNGRQASAESKKEIDQSPGESSGSNCDPWARLKWALHVMFSYRGIGTSRQVPNVPSFGLQVPSRSQFVGDQIVACIVEYLVLDLLTNLRLAPLEAFAPERANLFLAPRFWTVPILSLRLIRSFLFWVDRYITVRFIYDFTSIFGVGCGFTDPKDWPPYFGNISEAWTLRRFWATFWHSGLRLPLASNINFIVYDVIRLRRRSLEARTLATLLTFGLSGAIHYYVDEATGIPRSDNMVIRFFLLQAIGITLEDQAQKLYQQLANPRDETPSDPKAKKNQPTETWHRIVGYIWVILWTQWTMAPYAYSFDRNPVDPTFPISAVQGLKKYLA